MLKGRALLWYRNNKPFWLNWEDVIKSFKLYYMPHRYQHKLEEEIRNRVQRPRESASEYITDLLTLIRRHGGLSLGILEVFQNYSSWQVNLKDYLVLQPPNPEYRVDRGYTSIKFQLQLQ